MEGSNIAAWAGILSGIELAAAGGHLLRWAVVFGAFNLAPLMLFLAGLAEHSMLFVVSVTCLSVWALAGSIIAVWLKDPDRSAVFDCAMGCILVVTGLLLLI